MTSPLQRIELTHIRPYVRARLELREGMNVLFGPNGCGKTSVLESLYVVGVTKSFRAHKLSELLRFGQTDATIDVQTAHHHLSVSFKNRGKRLRHNGQAITHIEDFCGFFKLVLLAPEHTQLLSGAADLRRRYLDHILFYEDLHYARILKAYKKALDQKRALLKLELPFARYQDQVAPWDHQLIAHGTQMREKRANLVSRLNQCVPAAYQDLSQKNDALALSYSAADVPDLSTQIAKLGAAEHSAARVLCGPHRDDFLLYLNGQPVAQVGSQGERSSLLLSLKFTELALYQHTRPECPTVMLLDDVGITLDAQRRARLFDKLRDIQIQSLITTADQHIAHLCQQAGGDLHTQKLLQGEDGLQYVRWEGTNEFGAQSRE